jgi:DNA-binding transcriptional LysR family regulator
VSDPLAGVQAAIAAMAEHQGLPGGVLRISLAQGFGLDHILPLLPGFMQRYPGVRIDWQFDSRQVDLIAEGFDAAIGGGFEMSAGVVARALAPAHVIAVASPAYMAGRKRVTTPEGLAALDGIAMRSPRTGRVRQWSLRNAAGAEMPALVNERVVLNEPAAMCRAALLGLGVTLLIVPDALPHLHSGALVRLAPKWWGDAGAISLYYPSRNLMAAKTRAFVDFTVDAFRHNRLAEQFAGSLS